MMSSVCLGSWNILSKSPRGQLYINRSVFHYSTEASWRNSWRANSAGMISRVTPGCYVSAVHLREYDWIESTEANRCEKRVWNRKKPVKLKHPVEVWAEGDFDKAFFRDFFIVIVQTYNKIKMHFKNRASDSTRLTMPTTSKHSNGKERFASRYRKIWLIINTHLPRNEHKCVDWMLS